MDFLLKLTDGLVYIFLVLFIMLVSGIIKENKLFNSTFSYIKEAFHSNKLIVILISMIGGILPIEGRVTVSAGLLDTITTTTNDKKKFGIVDYLATHHYYLWSPLEKTVILPIAAFSISYLTWIGMIWPLLLVSLIFIFGYIYFAVEDKELIIETTPFKISDVIRNIIPFFAAIISYALGYNMIISFALLTLYYMFLTETWNFKKLYKYLKIDVLIIVALVIIFGNIVKMNASSIQNFIEVYASGTNGIISLAIISILSMAASFAMGSSSKFIAIAILLTEVLGIKYFLWFFALQYVGYLLSPTHKCVAIGNRYFGTSIKDYYKVLSIWSIILLITGFIFTFII